MVVANSAGLGFSWNKENHRTTFKAADPRGLYLNLEPAENKVAEQSIDRPRRFLTQQQHYLARKRYH